MVSSDGDGRGTWSGSTAFILAATGSAVGLGNVWKFPFITGVNGGGAFVLIYLAFIALVGLPLLAAEMIVGRRSRKEAVGGYQVLAAESGGSPAWAGFGFLAVACAFVLLSYYSVVGGWALAYCLKAASGVLTATPVDAIPALFDQFASNKLQVIAFHAAFMGIVIFIVLGGVRTGIERASKLLMPVLGVLLLVLFAKSLTMPGSGQAIRFMFAPDFSKLTPAGVLEALGHAFFTLSLGMGAMIAYGSYLQKKDSILGSAVLVAFFDTAVALVAGVMIFGIVFSFGMEPAAGPSLVFETMPVLFAQMPGGAMFATLFFVLVSFAAITSGISILEVAVAYFVDERGLPRRTATLLLGSIIFVVGLGSAINEDFFGWCDYLVTNWALPIGGLGIALFTGWVVHRDHVADELTGDPLVRTFLGFWRFATRYVAPIAIALVIAHSLQLI